MDKLEAVKKLYQIAIDQHNQQAITIIEDLFPELIMDKDERIRRALMEYFGEYCDTSNINGVYAYEVYEWIKKQTNRKPTGWNEDDDDVKDIAIRIIQNGGDDCSGILDSDKVLKWFESIQERVQPQQEWSDEDELHINYIVMLLEDKKKEYTESGKKNIEKEIEWLKSFKSRPKQE